MTDYEFLYFREGNVLFLYCTSKVNNFRFDLTDVSAKAKAFILSLTPPWRGAAVFLCLPEHRLSHPFFSNNHNIFRIKVSGKVISLTNIKKANIKYVESQSIVGTAYRAHIVLSTLACNTLHSSVLLPCPAGAMPLQGSAFVPIKTVNLQLYS